TINGGTVTLGFGLELLNIITLGGNDNATLSGLTIPTIVEGGDGNDTINASGVPAPITLLGGDGDDSLTGGSGNDRLEGGDGYDTLTGGPGDDTMLGRGRGRIQRGSWLRHHRWRRWPRHREL